MKWKLLLLACLTALTFAQTGPARAVGTCSCSTCWLPRSQWPATCIDTFNFDPPRERTQSAYCSSCH